jgi:hypothetical protein
LVVNERSFELRFNPADALAVELVHDPLESCGSGGCGSCGTSHSREAQHGCAGCAVASLALGARLRT